MRLKNELNFELIFCEVLKSTLYSKFLLLVGDVPNHEIAQSAATFPCTMKPNALIDLPSPSNIST
ncbi:hypothetical protein C0J52_17545 [Blattella germanica]|nr:hypothetical protein C0J52_17545 [Blattella germanica]